MGIASYIREIGRGKEGARALGYDAARDLMEQVLDGRASDLEIGAFAVAMRIKGETVPELAGFVDAVHARCLPIAAGRPAVLLPSYNGARKLPNLSALLALLLAESGVAVLVHGPMTSPGRVSTAEVFHDLGLPIARDAGDIHAGWVRRQPVFIGIDSLCPPLARLLATREVIGLRNPGHSVAKLLAPWSDAVAFRTVNHTHPEYSTLLAGYLAHAGADAMLLRGTEGEPVADARRTPRMDVFVAGQPRPELSLPAQDGVLAALPLLPRGHDAATTARYVQSVASGQVPAPAPIAAQVAALARAVGAAQARRAQERSA